MAHGPLQLQHARDSERRAVRLSCEMRGVGRVEAAAWARDAQGRSCGLHNAGSLSLER